VPVQVIMFYVLLCLLSNHPRAPFALYIALPISVFFNVFSCSYLDFIFFLRHVLQKLHKLWSLVPVELVKVTAEVAKFHLINK
jgi:hypothetical protein